MDNNTSALGYSAKSVDDPEKRANRWTWVLSLALSTAVIIGICLFAYFTSSRHPIP